MASLHKRVRVSGSGGAGPFHLPQKPGRTNHMSASPTGLLVAEQRGRVERSRRMGVPVETLARVEAKRENLRGLARIREALKLKRAA